MTSKFQDFFSTVQHYKSQKIMIYSGIIYGCLTHTQQQKNYRY